MVNYIQLSCMLRTYRTCNSTMGFSNYKFYNKLFSDVILLRITPGITWTQLIYIYIYMGWVYIWVGSSYTWCNSKQYYTNQYFLIGSKFWQIGPCITLSLYILYAYKILRWSKINSHVIY